jgi:cysteine-rich repeat protein
MRHLVSTLARTAALAPVLLCLACGESTVSGAGSGGGAGAPDEGRTLVDARPRDAAPAPSPDAVPFIDAVLPRDLGAPDAGAHDQGTGGAGGTDAVSPPDARVTECAADPDCEDGFFCNGAERCTDGACVVDPNPPCTDLNACTQNLCDEERNVCVILPDDAICAAGEICDPKIGCVVPLGCIDAAECDDGLPCNGVEDCVDRQCRPGMPVSCGDDVACTIDLCDDATGACTAVPDHGACAPGELCNAVSGCAALPPCGRDDDCDDGIFCNGAETCDVEAGLCRGGAAPVVDDAVPCTVDACSEVAGAVTHTPVNARCSDGVFCNGFEACHPVDGCRPGAPPPLEDGVGCTVGRCDEAAAFVEQTPDDAACDDGLFCNGAEVCDPVRDCVPGAPPAVNDAVGCTVDACSEATRSVLHRPDDTLCDDGVFCNGADVCDPAQGCVAGPPLDLDDGVECTEDLCLEGRREITHEPVDARCSDGAFCNGDEVCRVGIGCEPGAPPVVDDGVECTVDACDEARHIVEHTPEPAMCDNGLSCDGAETCDAARGCLPGFTPETDDGIACTLDLCDPVTGAAIHTPDDRACDDGLFCNGVETCDGARGCRAGTPPVLDDGVACTADTCDEDTDTVVHAAVPARCDDALFCNGAEICDAVRGCLPGVAPALTDNVACTVDTCDEANDRVIHTPDDAPCANGVFCDGAETCDAVRGCLPGAPPALTDNVACTTDACDEAGDRVTHAANNAACGNGLFCDGAETCDAARGCLPGAPPALTDNVACTTDACDEATDRVTHTANNAACGNGLFCDGAETCDLVRGCLAGAPPALTDNVACTVDTCDEANDRVIHTPNDVPCGNGVFCDGAETCDAVRGCLPGAPPVLTDNVACTTDACDEANDRVTHTANNAACSDNLFCNGAETCDLVQGCRAGAPPVVADNVACTTDACDEANDRVTHTPNNAVCSDNQFCNGAETCDAVLGCRAGAAPVLTDNVACTTDACDEATDRVTHTANNAACSDNLFCNGAETCDLAQGCRAGVAPVLNDNVACTDDTCDEANDAVRHTAVNARCDDAMLCNGSETCDAVLGCRAGNRAADGTVCVPNPRNLCIAGACAATRCGDRFVDAATGETCDDGNQMDNDGCSRLCRLEGVMPNYNGLFGVTPSLVYACVDIIFGDTVVNINATQLVFSVNAGTLNIAGLPVVMTQMPAPAGANFNATGVIAGGCTETYNLAGVFSDANHWCGVLNVSFNGVECGLSTCVNQTINVCGTRQ